MGHNWPQVLVLLHLSNNRGIAGHRSYRLAITQTIGRRLPIAGTIGAWLAMTQIMGHPGAIVPIARIGTEVMLTAVVKPC